MRRIWHVCLLLISAGAFLGVFAQPQTAGQPAKHPSAPRKKPVHTIRIVDDFTPYWLEQDVRWIVTDQERAAWKQLRNDEERGMFIEWFWQRRDATPDTFENEFKDEHYRRMVYANEQFAAAIPGWQTDRGRIYIMYGPPDQIESHPSGEVNRYSPEENGVEGSNYPFEVWRYRYLEGVGQEVEIEFVDVCRCGDYHMVVDQWAKDELLKPFVRRMPDKKQLGTGVPVPYVGPVQPPQVEFKDLEELVTHKIQVHQLPFGVHADLLKITEGADWVRLTLQVKNQDVTWKPTPGRKQMQIRVFGRVTTVTGRVAEVFESAIDHEVTLEEWSKVADGSQLYWKAVALKPGRYRLDVVLKDGDSAAVGTKSFPLTVPSYDDNKLAASSLILADDMAPSKEIFENFTIGSTRVRPLVEETEKCPAAVKRGDPLNLWMQVYALPVDQKSHHPKASIEYDVVNSLDNSVMHLVDTTEQLRSVGEQITLKKTLSLATLEPGK